MGLYEKVMATHVERSRIRLRYAYNGPETPRQQGAVPPAVEVCHLYCRHGAPVPGYARPATMDIEAGVRSALAIGV
jgi:hypothetical protein